jgi:hypothetical protein
MYIHQVLHFPPLSEKTLLFYQVTIFYLVLYVKIMLHQASRQNTKYYFSSLVKLQLGDIALHFLSTYVLCIYVLLQAEVQYIKVFIFDIDNLNRADGVVWTKLYFYAIRASKIFFTELVGYAGSLL